MRNEVFKSTKVIRLNYIERWEDFTSLKCLDMCLWNWGPVLSPLGLFQVRLSIHQGSETSQRLQTPSHSFIPARL